MSEEALCNLFEHVTHIIKENTEVLLDATMEVGPEVNTEKTKYLCLTTKLQDKS
jgi:hypothetical protein